MKVAVRMLSLAAAVALAGCSLGEGSGQTSTMPAQVRSRRSRLKIGKSSISADIWCSMTWNDPRWL